MCNYHYSDLNLGHQCPYPALFKEFKEMPPERLSDIYSDLFLPIDSDGICLFHSNLVEWKRENQFMKRFLQLANILNQLKQKRYDFRGFNFIGELDVSSKKDKPIYSIKIHDLTFQEEAIFDGSKFIERVELSEVKFIKGATFLHVFFQDKCNIKGSSLGFIRLNNTVFVKNTVFRDCHFNGAHSSLIAVKFQESVKFIDVLFDGITSFEDAHFNSSNIQNKHALFSNVQFEGRLTFKDAIFSCPVEFRKTVFNFNSEFQDTIFQASRSSSRYANADVQFHEIGIGEKGTLEFRGKDVEHKIFETDIEFSFVDEIKGMIHFVNANFQKISKISRDRLISLEKLGRVEIGAGCIKYRYKTEPIIIKTGKANQNLIIEMAQTFSNYFTVQNGLNLGVEIIERHEDRIHFFYFSDEEINENEFDSRLRNTEKRLWELLYIGPQDEQSIADSNQYLIPKNKENAFINAIDAAAALTSICLKVSVRALFGKWSEANTRDIMNAINFNKNTPVLSSENLHQNIINYNPTIINNTQKVFAAFKTEQTLNVPGTEED